MWLEISVLFIGFENNDLSFEQRIFFFFSNSFTGKFLSATIFPNLILRSSHYQTYYILYHLKLKAPIESNVILTPKVIGGN